MHYKQAGWWQNLKAKLQGWLGLRPTDPAAEAHLKAKEPDWKSFNQDLSRRQFRRALMEDPRTDAKLKRFVTVQNSIDSNPTEGLKIPSSKGFTDYDVKYDSHLKRYTCTCSDFKFRQFNIEGGQCKHIRQALSSQQKLSSIDPVQMTAFVQETQEIFKQASQESLSGSSHFSRKFVDGNVLRPTSKKFAKEQLERSSRIGKVE